MAIRTTISTAMPRDMRMCRAKPSMSFLNFGYLGKISAVIRDLLKIWLAPNSILFLTSVL